MLAQRYLKAWELKGVPFEFFELFFHNFDYASERANYFQEGNSCRKILHQQQDFKVDDEVVCTMEHCNAVGAPALPNKFCITSKKMPPKKLSKKEMD